MENEVNVIFDKLLIPFLEIKDCVLDLAYDDKKIRLVYPQNEPAIITLTKQFIKDKQLITIAVLVTEGKKYKKIAKGEINIYKKYFIGDKISIEKWIYLTILQNQMHNMGHNTDILKAEMNTGRIYMTLTLLHPVELKKKILIKDPIQSNKTERFRSVVENSNELLKKIKGKKEAEILEDLYEEIDDPKANEFDDNLSDLSNSEVDVNEENREGLELNQFAQAEYIANLKQTLEADYEKILPNDLNKLKQMNEVLYTKYTELSQTYNKILISLNEENEEMRKKAKDYYEKYKEIKGKIFKERRDLRQKKIDLKNGILVNREQNKSLRKEISNYQNELSFLKMKVNIKNEQESESMNKDADNLAKVLKKIHGLGYDILNGTNLNEEEKEKLKALLGIEEIKKEEVKPKSDVQIPQPRKENNENNKENHKENPQEDAEEQDDLQLGNEIINLIEKDVNELFEFHLINNVNIDQIDSRNYVFQDKFATRQVELYITNGKLTTNQGENFNEWLLKNFKSK